jgi:hypothetical protein
MKFNEFKPSSGPQLTEDQIYTQNLLKNFLESKITKKEFLKQIDESVGRDQLDEILPLALPALGLAARGAAKFAPQIAKGAAKYGGKALKGIKNFFGGGAKAVAKKTAKAATGKTATAASLGAMAPGMLSKSNVAKVAGGAALGAAAASALDTKPNAAFAGGAGAEVDDFRSIPKAKGPFKSGDGAEVDDFRAMPKTPPKPAARAKVKATAANTRDYDQTMAMQKKLIAQGANIKADGLMGPNTRAAMKAANMGAGGQKMRTDMPGGPRISNAKKPLMKPKATTAATKIAKKPAAKKPVAKKPRTLGKQNSKMPKSFGGIGPRVDDPKGGETVNLPFGMSYKTLPQQKDDGVA